MIPDDLLSLAGVNVDLTPEQLLGLSRKDVASIAEEGTRFEAVLTAGFSLQMRRTTASVTPLSKSSQPTILAATRWVS